MTARSRTLVSSAAVLGALAFANFAGALMVIPIICVVISWFKMLKQDQNG